MTFDQKIQIWSVIGTWVASIGTIAATIVALYLAKRIDKVQLKIYVNIVELFTDNNTPPHEHICIDVTNLGERPVTINTVGWAIGKGKKRKYCIQTLSGHFTNQYPIELAYGKNAKFMVSLLATPNWAEDFSKIFLNDLPVNSLKTLVAQVHTSVGQTLESYPSSSLIDYLKNHRAPNQTFNRTA